MSDHVQSIKELHLKDITRRFENGDSAAKIAKDIPVSQSTIGRWLKEEGYIAKKKGRYPKAMPSRARDIYRRKKDINIVAKILKVSDTKVKEWIGAEKNPGPLGGGKDPLAIKASERKLKSRKPRKRIISSSKWNKPIPQSHRCRKFWTEEEKDFVYALIKNKNSIKEIYLSTRASRQRQRRIWKEKRKSSDPENPPNIPRGSKSRSRKPRDRKDKKEIDKLKKECDRLKLLLESERAKIEKIESKRKEEEKVYKERRKALEAWEARSKRPLAVAPTPPAKRRVLPGSYEEGALGLPEGKAIREKKPKEKRQERAITEWADNREFFTVSNDWADLHDSTEDELNLFANFLTREGFPSKVTPSGDQPEAFFKDRWPKGVERRWVRSTERALEFLEAYGKRKREIKKENFSPQIAKNIVSYMANAYDAFRNAELADAQKEQAKKRAMAAWQEAGPIDQAIMHFSMGVAELTGAPTRKGVERGLAAKRMMTEDSDRLAKRMAKKRERLLEKEDAKKLLEARKRQIRGEGE